MGTTHSSKTYLTSCDVEKFPLNIETISNYISSPGRLGQPRGELDRKSFVCSPTSRDPMWRPKSKIGGECKRAGVL